MGTTNCSAMEPASLWSDAGVHLLMLCVCFQATIGLNGRPSNRTVVFRGFEENSDMIRINTDLRSRKIEELKHCPFSEVRNLFTRIRGSDFGSVEELMSLMPRIPDQTKLQVDYLNLKSNRRLLFSSMVSGTGDKCWTSEMANP
ncbi:unnamed protein product [Microthlaspi erraticum]|uniref:pyridoxal 5'-phosphate synthase n=1 Tax=Microthlaspi erraticum TaxID=1685480 RepID=A0A6D2LBK7_9BRAS|nr:unnamed protein product [Microthlaspi erraticum]